MTSDGGMGAEMAGEMITIAHPGRYGDCLWALPTMRVLSEVHHGAPVRLLLPTDPANTTPMADFSAMLRVSTDYLLDVQVIPEWSITQDAPRMPKAPPGVATDYALGYESWPTRPLPYETAALGHVLGGTQVANGADFFRPWLKVHAAGLGLASGVPRLAVHWTDRYFELKLGILKELQRNLGYDIAIDWYAGPGSRMHEAGATAVGWLALARALAAYDVVLTDCSAAHVLAMALGVERVLVVEPEQARHHEIFWPGSDRTQDGHWHQRSTGLGRTIYPVLGGDGRPTFDSRHTADYVQRAIASRGEAVLCA